MRFRVPTVITFNRTLKSMKNHCNDDSFACPIETYNELSITMIELKCPFPKGHCKKVTEKDWKRILVKD